MDDYWQERRPWARACRDRLLCKALVAREFCAYSGDQLAVYVPSSEVWLPCLVRADHTFLTSVGGGSGCLAVGAHLMWTESWCRTSAACRKLFEGGGCWTRCLVGSRDGLPDRSIHFLVLEHL